MATLLEIRDKVKERADVQSEAVRYPDAELNRYINDSYKELYGILVKHSLVREESSTTVTALGSTLYLMPTDFFAVLGVWKEEGDYYRALDRHSFKDRPFGGAQALTGEAFTYRIAKQSGSRFLELFPRPQSGTYLVTYVPVPSDLSADTDTFDDVLGWDEYVVVDASIKVLRKEESSTVELERDKAALMARIEQEAEAEELAQTLTVAYTRRYGGSTRRTWRDPADFRWYRNGDDF